MPSNTFARVVAGAGIYLDIFIPVFRIPPADEISICQTV